MTTKNLICIESSGSIDNVIESFIEKEVRHRLVRVGKEGIKKQDMTLILIKIVIAFSLSYISIFLCWVSVKLMSGQYIKLSKINNMLFYIVTDKQNYKETNVVIIGLLIYGLISTAAAFLFMLLI